MLFSLRVYENGGIFMYLETIFYLSRVVGKKVYDPKNNVVGTLRDIVVTRVGGKPQVTAFLLRSGRHEFLADAKTLAVVEVKGQFILRASKISTLAEPGEDALFLKKNVLDKQIVDINGVKMVRVNDLRLAQMKTGIYVVAVDVGIEGLLRRIGIAKPLKKLVSAFGGSLPNKLILWDDVETVDVGQSGIRLAKTYAKLETLHVSDLADIIEDMDAKMQREVFASLDDEKAADVLEELESDAQQKVLGNLPVDKAADLLEKMPADEAADILEDMPEERAEKLLSEMEREASEEVRRLLEYEDDEVGALMTTDFLSYGREFSIERVLDDLRRQKPEASEIYSLNVVDESEHLIASVSLRDVVVAQPRTKLAEIMNSKVIYVRDTDKIGSITELISKYNLLAVPVVDKNMVLVGMVIIDDVVYTLLKTRKHSL